MPGIETLCQQLGEIALLLEKGDAEAAAAIVPEMTENLASASVAATEEQLREARTLLGRCTALERDLREKMTAAFWRLGAARKTRVYRSR